MHYLSLVLVLLNVLTVFGQQNFTIIPVLSSSITPTPSSTVHPSSTVTPTLTPLTQLCHSVLDAKNRTCVRVCFDWLNVTTTFKDSTKHSYNGTTVRLPLGVKVTGSCSEKSGPYNVSSIEFSWNHYSVFLNFSFNIKKIDGRKLNGDVNEWYLSSVSFKNATNVYFQNTTANATISATIGHSYKCDNTLTFHMANVTMDTIGILQFKNYQVQAFATPDEKKFDFGDTIDCVPEASLPAYIPIIVGCALAGLVLLVLVAYVIGRCYKGRKDDYETLS